MPSQNGDALAIDAEGQVVQRYAVLGEQRDRVRTYINDLRGGDVRYALVSDQGLCLGLPGSAPELAPLPDMPIAGPIVIGDQLDQLLVVATVDGSFVAYNEVEGRVEWTFPTEAADVSQLTDLGNGRVVAVLDGSRLACFELNQQGARRVWEHSLQGKLLSRPVIQSDGILVVTSAGMWATTPNGANRQIPSDQQPSAVAQAGDVLAVGTQDGLVRVRNSDVNYGRHRVQAR